MATRKEKIKKVNFALFPSSVRKAKKLAKEQDRSVSSLLRNLIEQEYGHKYPCRSKLGA